MRLITRKCFLPFNKGLWTIWLMFMLIACNSQADDLYLEGVSLFGAKRSAYLSLNGGKVSVNEGDTIGVWRVIRIEQRSVFLTTEQGKDAQELPLYTSLALPKPSEENTVTTIGVTDKSVTYKPDILHTEEKPKLPSAVTDKPVVVTDNVNVPPGHRRVKTPFGEFLVKEDSLKEREAAIPTTHEATAQPNLPRIPDDKVPSGHRKVKTPFGEFLVKEKD